MHNLGRVRGVKALKRRSRWRRRALVGALALLVLAAGAWVGTFSYIRWRAHEDYEALQDGRWPERIRTRDVLPMADGGSTGYRAFGYRLSRLHRFHGWPPDQQHIIGPRLEFTCRRWFPVLERFLVDREDTTIVARVRQAALQAPVDDVLPRLHVVRSGADVLLVQVHFVDGMVGFAVGGNAERGTPAALLRTADGGASWSALEVGALVRLYDVHFPSPTIGFAGGLDGTLLRSDDGGLTWRDIPAFDGGWIAAVHFVSERQGFVAGAGGAGMLLARTDDGGATWRSIVEAVPEPARTIGLRDMHFVDASIGIATGYDGLIIRTRDGGASWQTIESGSGAWLKSISFATPSTGYIAGSGGTVLRSDDAGASWRIVPFPKPEKLNGIAFTTAERGLAAGAEGGIWCTTDGGASWRELPPSRRGLTAAHAAPDGTVWVGTEAGELLRVRW